jgi:hypothetical protein
MCLLIKQLLACQEEVYVTSVLQLSAITDWIVGNSARLTCVRTHRWAALRAGAMTLSAVSCVSTENISNQSCTQIRNKLYTRACAHTIARMSSLHL